MRSLKFFFAVVALFCMTAAYAQPNVPEKEQRKGFEFTTVKANPITGIRNQGSSGTCWAFSTTSFFESEAIRNGHAEPFSNVHSYKELHREDAQVHPRRRLSLLCRGWFL